MKNRLCVSDKLLAQYLHGTISKENREIVETHISHCDSCLELISDAYILTRKNPFQKIKDKLICFVRSYGYILLSASSLIMSFFIKKYFIQFITVSVLLGIKSILNAKTAQLFIMVKDSLKKENENNIKTHKK